MNIKKIKAFAGLAVSIASLALVFAACQPKNPDIVYDNDGEDPDTSNVVRQ